MELGTEGVATDLDVVAATEQDVDTVELSHLLTRNLAAVEVVPLLSAHPIYWTRLRSPNPVPCTELGRLLRAGGIRVRYVTSTRQHDPALAPAVRTTRAWPQLDRIWPTRIASQIHAAGTDPWQLGRGGIAVKRRYCGTGAGTRLAVIAAGRDHLHRLPLDAAQAILPEAPTGRSLDSALLTAWAVGTTTQTTRSFIGVAPDAAVRLYRLPSDDSGVLALPLAVASAVRDGADVVLCSRQLEPHASPLLDDALELAQHCGRSGRGTMVIVPGGSEMSPNEDPRVLYVAGSPSPGASSSPGPSPRSTAHYLAPGEQLEQPDFVGAATLGDANLAAAALTTGIALLVLECNPTLRAQDIARLLRITATGASESNELLGGHRVHATRSCLAATDPVAAAFVLIGQDNAAIRYLEARRDEAHLGGVYSIQLARWLARTVLTDDAYLHTACTLAEQTLRLSRSSELGRHDASGLLRQLGIMMRSMNERFPATRGDDRAGMELSALTSQITSATRSPNIQTQWLRTFNAVCSMLWNSDTTPRTAAAVALSA